MSIFNFLPTILTNYYNHNFPPKSNLKSPYSSLRISLISTITLYTFLTYLLLNNNDSIHVYYILLILFIFFIFSISLISKLKHSYEYSTKQYYYLAKQQFYSNSIDSEKQSYSASIAHDIRNSLFAILCYMQNQDYDKAQNKIDEICGCLQSKSQDIITGNKFLDKLIISKMNMIKYSNISLNVKSNLNENSNIDIFDLCILLGNSLDNAIEACYKINDYEKRFIKIFINYDSNFLSLSISNPINEFVKTDLSTTKVNKNIHGFGIKNMKRIVKKYKGDFFVSQDNNIFYLNINIKPLLVPKSILDTK